VNVSKRNSEKVEKLGTIINRQFIKIGIKILKIS
jgi:hypothetical protein